MQDERKRLRKELIEIRRCLQQSEERFTKIFHNSSNPMAISSVKDGRIIDINEAYARFSGFEREEVVGQTTIERGLWKDPLQRNEIIRRLQQYGKVHNLEVEIQTKTGEAHTVLFSMVQIILNNEPHLLSTAIDITERKSSEERVRESEEKYRTLAENSLQGLAIVQDLRIVFCNTAFAEIIGYTVDEILSLAPEGVQALIHIEDQPLLLERQRDRLAGKSVKSRYEHRAIKKGGTEIWVEMYAILTEYKGKPAIQATFVDITERKRAEASAKESNERLVLAFQGAGMSSWDLNVQTGELKDDDQWLQILGYLPGEIEPNVRFWGQLIHPDDRELFLTAFAAHLEGKTPLYEVEHRIRHKSGSWVWVLDRGKIIARDSLGKPLRVVGVHADITARKQVGEALRASEERFKRLVQNSNDIITTTDERGIQTSIIGPLEKLFGYRQEELIGTSGFDLMHPDDREYAFRTFAEAMLHPGAARRIEYRYRHKNGDWVPVETVGTNLLQDPIVKSVVLNIRVTSERKKLEAQLQQATKMEAVGALAAGVAHDFNNLLNVINGYCELLLDDFSTDDPKRSDLSQIKKAGQRAAALTSQLLAFSRKQIIQPEILNLNDVIEDIRKMIPRLIGENIEFAAIAKADLWSISADPGQIHQIIMNLTINARDAMPDGGKLVIEVGNFILNENHFGGNPDASPGPYVMLAISDNGTGMDEETQSHLFEPFFTTKGHGKGTGLGLSTIYGIVKQNNGFIWVYSEPGKGTTFKIYFPRVEGQINRAAGNAEFEPQFRGSETVLVAEDEESVRGLASRILREQGYAVFEASAGEEALSFAQSYPGEIHLVLTDVVMPGMNGRDLVDRIKASRPCIKSLFVSGYTNDAIVHHGILDPGVFFLQKPFTIESLARKVREVLDS